jgi:hypothetical protein
MVQFALLGFFLAAVPWISRRVVWNGAQFEKCRPDLPPPAVVSDQIGNMRFPNNAVHVIFHSTWI